MTYRCTGQQCNGNSGRNVSRRTNCGLVQCDQIGADFTSTMAHIHHKRPAPFHLFAKYARLNKRQLVPSDALWKYLFLFRTRFLFIPFPRILHRVHRLCITISHRGEKCVCALGCVTCTAHGRDAHLVMERCALDTMWLGLNAYVKWV